MNQVLNTMNRIIKLCLIAVILVLLLLLLVKAVQVNRKYPSPEIQTYGRGEVISIGSYEISLTDWKWGDGEIIHEVYPEYVLIEIDGEEYPTDKERVGLAELTIQKVEEDDIVLDLTSVYFESDAWGNQFDLDLFLHLNPELNGPWLKLEEGQKAKVTLPITMQDYHFSSKSWKNIDDRLFYIVFQYYPEKIQLLCNRDVER